MSVFEIRLAKKEDEIKRCYPIMIQLRPHLSEKKFVDQVIRQQLEGGYKLAYIERSNEIKALTGFRIQEMLSRGRFLYVDDLITDTQERSNGYGDALFDWLMLQAELSNCKGVELDSGVQREGAHRFYFRRRMRIAAYHFSLELPNITTNGEKER